MTHSIIQKLVFASIFAGAVLAVTRPGDTSGTADEGIAPLAISPAAVIPAETLTSPLPTPHVRMLRIERTL